MSGYQGDIKLGQTITAKFTTVNTSGVPTTLAGSPVVAAYVGSSTTEITAGVSISVDFDGRTGYHLVTCVATTGNGFATATDISLALTAGTVGGSSVVGYETASFSIENRVQNIGSVPILTGAYPQLGISDSGTSQASGATTLQLRASSPAYGTNDCAGNTCFFFFSGRWQERAVNSNTSGAGGTLTFDAAASMPTGAIPYILFGTAPLSSGTAITNNVTQIAGSSAAATSFMKMLTAVAGETLTANITGSLSGAVASVTGDVSGSIHGNVNGSVNSVVSPVSAVLSSVPDVNVTKVIGVPLELNGTGTQNVGGP